MITENNKSYLSEIPQLTHLRESFLRRGVSSSNWWCVNGFTIWPFTYKHLLATIKKKPLSGIVKLVIYCRLVDGILSASITMAGINGTLRRSVFVHYVSSARHGDGKKVVPSLLLMCTVLTSSCAICVNCICRKWYSWASGHQYTSEIDGISKGWTTTMYIQGVNGLKTAYQDHLLKIL